MKIAYFDCFSGISGDMLLGSLIDAGLKVEELKTELEKLNISGYRISSQKSQKKGIWGTDFKVKLKGPQQRRNLQDIFKIIDNSSFNSNIKEQSKTIFSQLAEAEAKIHNKSRGEIHFHELGATDALVDIVGTIIGIEKLAIKGVYVSELNVGGGFAKSTHGTLPVPAPATLELLKGVPIYSRGRESELVTPTGAAIITSISNGFGGIPPVKPEVIGYGLGDKDLPFANALRIIIGEKNTDSPEEKISLLETNIDDMNPQIYDYIMTKLLQKGAKDVFLTPVYMKKNRPGTILSIIASPEDTEELLNVLFEETTTLGVRIHETKRRVLTRKSVKINTRHGEVNVKLRITKDGRKEFSPEYEDCKRIAQSSGKPLRVVYEELKGEVAELIEKERPG